MHTSIRLRLWSFLALSWCVLTSIYLLAISFLILRDAAFPLNLGSVRTTGRTGLWLTLLPGLFGILAVLLTIVQARASAWLLGTYSIFWAGVLVSGLPGIWNARMSFCTQSFCITTPWIGRFLLLALAMPFLMVAFWAFRQAHARQTDIVHG